MEKKKFEPPAHFNIDEKHYLRYTSLKDKHKEDSEHYTNKLDFSDIYILSIGLALKNHRKPAKSGKTHWFLRTASITRGSSITKELAIIKSLVYKHASDLKMVLPEYYEKFYSIAEQLANAGFEDALELLETPKLIEQQILMGVE
jgi:hypothetical protein